MANNINKVFLIGCFFSCHSKEHMSKYEVVREGLKFDHNGNLIEVWSDN